MAEPVFYSLTGDVIGGPDPIISSSAEGLDAGRGRAGVRRVQAVGGGGARYARRADPATDRPEPTALGMGFGVGMDDDEGDSALLMRF